ncbi:TetR/AcrR family transcriptional regulator, partial [Virgisporangium aliadipatigenens]|uniref:TetR/AcrR family transcriptional regulator n=1 Tax=Virgisporangium aliadipatigenens TaxID=741659 RepID=UPI001940C66D
MSLREVKQLRTRQALATAAADLFRSRGFDGTTLADVAAAAEVGTRTLFRYFAGKEDLLFPDHDDRVAAAVRTIDGSGPPERPAEVLLRALAQAESDEDVASGLAALRLRLIRENPTVRARALQLYSDAQLEIARALTKAFPEQLDTVGAAALTGAFAGAVQGALCALIQDPTDFKDPAAYRNLIDTATRTA